MIKEISCYNFPGFYESIFCNSDEFIDDEYELQWELESLVGEGKVEVHYEYDDFNKYKLDVSNKFMEYYIEEIKKVLPSEITDHEEFKLDKIDCSTSVSSPEYYNYRTDSCYCEIETNSKTLNLIKKHTLKLEGVDKYIKSHFTSCDGFISFISNDINYWKSLDIEEYETNMLTSLLDMLISLSPWGDFERIILGTYYDIDKYYYADAVIEYKERDKKLREKGLKILKENGYEING